MTVLQIRNSLEKGLWAKDKPHVDGPCVKGTPASLVHSILVTSTGPLSVAMTTHPRQAAE